MAPAQPSRRPRAAHRHDRWVPVHFNRTRNAAFDGKGIAATEFNGAEDAFLTTLGLTGGSSPARIRMDPAAGRLYVGNNGINSISVIDTAVTPPAFPILLADVPAGPGAKEINLNATTDRIYVSNKGNQSVSIIDRTTYAVVDTVPAGIGPFNFGFSNAEDVVYVSNEDLNSFEVTVIGEPLPSCTLELSTIYESFTKTLTLDMVIGTSVPATFDLLATSSQGTMKPIARRSISQELGSPSLPVTADTPVSLTEKIKKPLGIIGILATLRAPDTGVICTDSTPLTPDKARGG